MPTLDYGGVGTYTWTVPFAVNAFTGTVIGGGGSGYRDCDGDDLGGGGGGGGIARSSTSVNSGNSVTIRVGAGGSSPGCDTGNAGDRTFISGGGITLEAFGGGTGTDDDGGGGGGTGVGSYRVNGTRGKDDDAGRDGGGGGGCGYCGNNTGGRGVNLDTSCGGCPGGRNGAGFGGGGAGNDGGSAGAGANGAARIEYNFIAPIIQNLSATPNPQNSVSGTPQYTSTVFATVTWASSATLSGNGQSFSLFTGNTSSSPINISRTVTLPQSTAGSNSPANATFTISASGPGGTVSQSIVISARNDNNPNNLTIPSTTTSGRALNNLEPPPTTYVIDMGVVSGIDMPTLVSNTNNCNVSTTGSGSGSDTLFINDGQRLYVHFTSQPFNTNPSGLTNPGSLSFTIGPDSYTVNFATRAPVVREIFDFEGPKNAFPNPDIDTVTAPTPKTYIETGDDNSSSQIDVTCDDIEIAVEIKVGNANAQVQVNQDGVWRNMRQI